MLLFQYNIDYQGTLPPKWRPLPAVLSDISPSIGSHSQGSAGGSLAGSDTSDRDSVKSSRSDQLLRSMSLNRAYTTLQGSSHTTPNSVVGSPCFEPRV